jgi:alpha-amylase/alpha-mannosidase (GH57 family)
MDPKHFVDQKLNIAFLWHQHQPFYKQDGVYKLPWVRFHGSKDYYDMVRILDDFPKIRQNFNLVPSLLVQIQDYINNNSRDVVWHLSKKDPNDLTDQDKNYILKNFFNCYHDRMIYPYPRYAELLKLRGDSYDSKYFSIVKEKFKYQDWFDLQVWFNFVWIGEYSKYDKPFKKIIEKGRDFTEEHKKIVLDDSIEILKKVIDKHKTAAEEGRIEISVSPFYHPILPLLCDTNIAKVSDPGVKLPDFVFSHPEDALHQISRSLEYYNSIFGKYPSGIWPSEGSVSEEVLKYLVDAGIKWTATDEMVLYNSLENKLGSHSLFRPYSFNTANGNIKIVFRDHVLSDLIGFTYNNWNPDDAARDFIGHLYRIREGIMKNKKFPLNESLVSIILDGENCWEYYQSDGKDFLRTLYWMLSNDSYIKTTTINDFISGQSDDKISNLPKIFPGSWINGNFKIWIGHDEDNRAWDLISMVRNFIVERSRDDKIDQKIIKAAWEEIYIAEGSDWNWWYGDEHHTVEINSFDEMFRGHLINVYSLFNEETPAILMKSIKSKLEKIKIAQPKAYIYPAIDGKLSFKDEWKNAGIFETTRTGGVMHKVASTLRKIYFGYNEDNVFIRIDCMMKIERECKYIVHFLEPFEIDIKIMPSSFEISWKQDTRKKPFDYGFGASYKDFLEIFLSREDFSLVDNSFISFEIIAIKDNSEVERIPKDDLIRFKLESKKSLEYRELF